MTRAGKVFRIKNMRGLKGFNRVKTTAKGTLNGKEKAPREDDKKGE